MLVFLCPKGTLTELRVAMVVGCWDQLQPQDNNDNDTPCCCLRFCYCIVIVCLLFAQLHPCLWVLARSHAASTSKTNGLFLQDRI